MILAETWYKTHNSEFLVIIEAFKIWRHYLEGYKHKVLVLTNHNNLCRFIQTISLSSCQVWWAQELSRYHFWIDYYQDKANGLANALSRFSQRSDDKEEKFWANNSQIFHWLQSSVTNTSLSKLSLSRLNVTASSNLSPLHQVLICGTHGLPQLRQFQDMFRLELANKSPYQVSIGSILLRLQELQETNSDAQELRPKDG